MDSEKKCFGNYGGSKRWKKRVSEQPSVCRRGRELLATACEGVFHINELHTSVLRPQFDGGVGSEALQVLRGQGDEVVGVLLQVADGVVLKE